MKRAAPAQSSQASAPDQPPQNGVPAPTARGHASLPPNLSGNLAAALTAAAAALARVAQGKSLDQALEAASQGLAAPERAAAQDIAYTACRRLNLLDAVAARLMKKSNPAIDYLVRAACSQLIDHAPQRAHVIVDQAVTAAAGIANGAFKGLVNGVLRSFLRGQDPLLRELRADEAVRLAYPHWWIERVRHAWPARWEAILAAGNQPPPMTLRVNLRRGTVEAYAERLAAAGITAHRSGPVALTLERPLPAARLPGFAAGDVSVQDLGAQCAAYFLGAAATRDADAPLNTALTLNADATFNATATRSAAINRAARPFPLRVLDACAAPGGKTAHLLESLDCDVTALDSDAARLAAVRANLMRLGLDADCKAADAADLNAWWDGTPFDLVLLDAPCTASGVVSRHPDSKWLKRAGDAAKLKRIQLRLLDALWQVLKPGGTLLYATCSVFPEENTGQVDAWLTRHTDARRVALPALPGVPGAGDGSSSGLEWIGGQLLPDAAHDGFFYVLIEKI